MADCGNHDYQMIEYANLFDLRDMQLYRAQIDMVYGTTNTADITMLDPCPEYSTTPEVLGVPFWYHCDYSTGTLADLAKGYRAFSVYDIVYVLAVPANGSVPARMYIVGHVDIRGTHGCPYEYLFITFGFYFKSIWREYTTVYDPSSGLKLDLSTFTPKDSGSPAAPASLPCATSSMTAWKAYNFGTLPIDGYVISGTITTNGGNIEATFDPVFDCTTTSSSVAYSGSDVSPCDSFSIGNGLSSDLYSQSCHIQHTSPSLVELWGEDGHEYHGNAVAKVFVSGVNCGPVYTSTSFDSSFSEHGNSGYLKVTGTSGAVAYIPLVKAYERANDSSSACNVEGTAIMSASYSGSYLFDKEIYYDFSSLSVTSPHLSRSFSLSATGQLPTTPTFSNTATMLTIDSSTVSHAGEIPRYDITAIAYTSGLDMYFLPLSSMNSASTTFYKGRYYTYTIMAALSVEEWTITGAGSECSAYFGGYVYPGVVTVEQAGGTAKLKLSCKSFSCVAPMSAIVPPAPAYAISAIKCIQYTNQSKANGLNAALEELVDYIVDDLIDYSTLPTANEDLELLRGELMDGPTIQILAKL